MLKEILGGRHGKRYCGRMNGGLFMQKLCLPLGQGHFYHLLKMIWSELDFERGTCFAVTWQGLKRVHKNKPSQELMLVGTRSGMIDRFP